MKLTTINILINFEEEAPKITLSKKTRMTGGERVRLRELLDRDIDTLGFSFRVYNCLSIAKIKTIRDLVTRETNLLWLRNFGKGSFAEVVEKLKELGLSLHMEIPDGV